MRLPLNTEEVIPIIERLATNVAGRLFKGELYNAYQPEFLRASNVDAYFHPLYGESVRASIDLAVHFTPGTPAGHLISETRPYEAPELANYRKDIYQPVTQSYGAKITNLQRANLFNPREFYLIAPQNNDSKIPEEDSIFTYVTSEIPGIGDIRKYFSDAVLVQAQRDVNGWYVLLPAVSDADFLAFYGEAARDNFREPFASFIPSSHALYYGQNFLLAQADEWVKVGSKDGGSKEAAVLFVFTDNTTLRLQPTSIIENEIQYTAEIYHAHGLTFKDVAYQVGGTISKRAGSVLTNSSFVLYDSPLMPAVPFFNTAVQELSDLRAAIITHLHPQRYEAEMICETCNGTRKSIEGDTCGTCSGTGMIPSSTTMHAITVEPNANGEIKAPAGYVSFETDIIVKAFEWYRHNVEEAFSSLSMDFLFAKPGNSADTARGKEIDREELHGHFIRISELIFPLFQWMLDGINAIRYGVILGNSIESNRVIVHFPTTFDTTKANESLQRFNLSKEAGADVAYLIELSRDMYAKTLGSQSAAYKRSILALELDPIALAGIDEILGLNAINAGFTDSQIQYKARLPQMIAEAERENPEFLELHFEDQKAAIDRIFLSLDITQPPEGSEDEPEGEVIVIDEPDSVV